MRARWQPAWPQGWWGSLKLRLTLAGLAALTLSVALTALLLVQRAERDTLAGERERELQEAARTAAVLSARVVDLQQALQLAAEQLDAGTLRDPAALARFFEARSVMRRMFGHVFAAAPDGRVRLYGDRGGAHERETVSLADRPYFRQTLREGRPVVSEAIPGRAVPEPIMVLTYPLRDRHGVYGLLAGVLRLSSGDLLRHVLQQQRGASVLLVVTDDKGHILAHPDPRRLMQPLASEPRLAAAWNDWVRQREPLEPLGVSVAQPGEIASVAAVSGPQWLVWRALPEQELLQPLHAARRHALGWALVMVAVAGAMLLALVTWLLAPLHALERRAQVMSGPEQDPHAGWPTAAGEIGRLARVLRHASATRAQLEAFNADLLGRLESVMAAAPVGIAFTREDRFELVNAELCTLLGQAQHELAGRPLAQVLFPDDTAPVTLLREVYRGFLQGRAYRGEWELKRADGQHFWAELGVRPANPADPTHGLIWTVTDISAQVLARAQLQWRASHDPLTGLANRSAFGQRLAQVFQAQPTSRPAALLAIDLDHFKPVNDSAGHAAGDAMLKVVADAIRGCVRNGDVVGRHGGDEFVVLLDQCPAAAAQRIAQEVCEAIAAIRLPWDGQELDVGASVGVAMLQPGLRDAAHWLSRADQACYAAKRGGRGQVHMAREDSPQAA